MTFWLQGRPAPVVEIHRSGLLIKHDVFKQCPESDSSPDGRLAVLQGSKR